MSESPLSRIAAPVAIATGAGFAAVHLALFAVADRSDLVGMIADPAFRVFDIAYALMFSPLLIALVAVYGRQARAAGTFGVVGLCAAIVGTLNLGADMWLEAFASPWLVEVAPGVLSAPKSPLWQVGYLSSSVLFALGWVLFGLSCLRARVFPAAISLAVMLGGAIGFLAAMPPFGAPLGLAVAALGGSLVRSRQYVGQLTEPAVS